MSRISIPYLQFKEEKSLIDAVKSLDKIQHLSMAKMINKLKIETSST